MASKKKSYSCWSNGLETLLRQLRLPATSSGWRSSTRIGSTQKRSAFESALLQPESTRGRSCRFSPRSRLRALENRALRAIERQSEGKADRIVNHERGEG